MADSKRFLGRLPKRCPKNEGFVHVATLKFEKNTRKTQFAKNLFFYPRNTQRFQPTWCRVDLRFAKSSKMQFSEPLYFLILRNPIHF